MIPPNLHRSHRHGCAMYSPLRVLISVIPGWGKKCVLENLPDIIHSHVWRNSLICDMTYSCVRHDSFIRDVTHWCAWPIFENLLDMTLSYVWHNSLICETWLIHVCDMTHLYATRLIDVCDIYWRICSTWFIRLCDITHWYVTRFINMWPAPFMCLTWLIHMCDMTQ